MAAVPRPSLDGLNQGAPDTKAAVRGGDLKPREPWRHIVQGIDLGRHQQARPGRRTVTAGEQGDVLCWMGGKRFEALAFSFEISSDYVRKFIHAPSRENVDVGRVGSNDGYGDDAQEFAPRGRGQTHGSDPVFVPTPPPRLA